MDILKRIGLLCIVFLAGGITFVNLSAIKHGVPMHYDANLGKIAFAVLLAIVFGYYMAHRTLNPKTAFYGDMHETGRKRKPARRNKQTEAEQIYRQEFHKEPPFYLGAAFDMYRQQVLYGQPVTAGGQILLNATTMSKL
jgi:hypothetical protein